MERARGGDWTDFLRIYPPLIFVYALRRGLRAADAEDVTQQTLAALLTALPSFEYDRNKMFRAYLRTAVRRNVAHLLGSQVRAGNAELVEDLKANECGPDELFDHHWRLEHLYRALEIVRQQVAPRSYQAFELYALRGRSPEQVADFLGMTPNHVYQCKYQLLSRLRSILEEELEA